MKVFIYMPLLAAALLLGWQLLRSPEASQAPVASLATTAMPSPSQITNTTPAQALLPDAPSLRGTEVDGQLQTDDQGNLLLTDQLRQLFDYYLSTRGELSQTQIELAVREQISQALTEPARGQALALFKDYLAYLQAVAELEQQFPLVTDLDDLWARQEAVERLRAGLFSREQQAAFFAAEEVYNRFTLERLAILQNTQLSRDEKAMDIEALRENLPEEMHALLVPQLHQTLAEKSQAVRAAGGDQQAIDELRLSLVGPEATERLQALDQQRAEWQQRLDDYQQQRNVIMNQSGLADSDRQSAANQLLTERFSPAEQLRIAALEGNLTP